MIVKGPINFVRYEWYAAAHVSMANFINRCRSGSILDGRGLCKRHLLPHSIPTLISHRHIVINYSISTVSVIVVCVGYLSDRTLKNRGAPK